MGHCLIYGHDGFDLDVLYNLRALYRDLGFTVSFSNQLRKADLLVVQRCPNAALDVSGYETVHVYDYVGNDISLFLESLVDAIGVSVFSSSSARVDEHLLNTPGLAGMIFDVLPPVSSEIWAVPLADVQYPIVHIGNYKPVYSTGEDAYSRGLMRAVNTRATHVWGAGWTAPGATLHGKLNVFKVSGTYARAQVALGMMYPFQRETTFSGRFWQAPLNGCLLLSEPSLYSKSFPGVLQTDYSNEDISGQTAIRHDRQELQVAAKLFWDEKYEDTRAAVIRRLPVRFQKSRSRSARLPSLETTIRSLKHRFG
jgi:hypothetical protein